MSTESRHDRVASLFAAARALSPGERGTFLDEGCGGDDSLRTEVEDLLRLSDGDDSLLDEGPGSTLRRGAERSLLARADEDRALPESIGEYRILGVLGRGGMGIVYEAEQARPRRHVALKVLRASMRDADARRRFELEAEILGRLQHPGIAQVLEAGVADIPGVGPQPFLAMELVRGTTLSEHARRHELSLLRKIELLALACDAVQHAHERGVIHRDLKPGNILVDEEGRPRVVDFGIARVMDAGAPAHSLTQSGHVLGTLAYMAPEQVSGRSRDVDARTDCWALGAVGWELVTGKPPHDVTGLSLPEAARRISEGEVPRLSSVRRMLRGDLETVLGKALERDPARRYASVSELASDLRRYLADEPILARPPSALYQLRKFSRRHWGIVAGASLAVLALIAGTAVATWQAGVARHRADEAEAARGDAERLAYRASLTAAVAALEGDNFIAARRSLAQAPQSLRGWEWRVLASRLDASESTARPLSGRFPLRIEEVEPDGRTLALVEWETGDFLRWDAFEGRPRDAEAGAVGLARPMRLPPDSLPLAGKLVKFGPTEDVVEVQDLDGSSRAELRRLSPHGVEDGSRLLLGDGTVLAALSSEAEPARSGVVRADPRTGRPSWFQGGFPGTSSLTLTPGARSVLACRGGDARIALIDVDTGSILHESAPLGDDAAGFDLSADGGRIVIGSHNGGRIHLVDGGSLQLLASQRIHRARTVQAAFADEGRLIVSSGSEGSLVSWAPDLSRRIGAFAGHEATVVSIRPLPALGMVATCDELGTLKLWRTDVLSRPPGIAGPFGTYVYHALWSPDGRRILVVPFDARPHWVDARNGRVISSRPSSPWAAGTSATGLALAPDGAIVLAAVTKSIVRLDPETFEVLGEATGCGGRLVANPGGTHAVAVGHEGAFFLDLRTLEVERLSTSKHDGAAWSPDGRLFATCTLHGKLTLRDGATREVVREIDLPGVEAGTLAWSTDGSVLAIGAENRQVMIVTPEGREVARLPHEGRVLAVSFSPDGRRLLVGGDGGLLRVVDTARWEEIVALAGHDSYIYSVSWAPDGASVATASGDGTARIWSPAGGS